MKIISCYPSLPHFRIIHCVTARFSWERNFILIHRGHQSSSKCLFDEICKAAEAIGKSELLDYGVTAVSDGRVAHFSRLGERVRRLAEDAAFLSRRFLCFSAFPSFSLFLRILEHPRREIRFRFQDSTLIIYVHIQTVDPTQKDAVTPLFMHAPLWLQTCTHRNMHVCLAMCGIVYWFYSHRIKWFNTGVLNLS